MKKTVIIFLTFILGATFSDSLAQNLVPNYSFEIADSCPSFSASSIFYAPPWISSSNYGSPDYFNSCSGPLYYGVPVNSAGRQNAKDGNAYAGICVYLHTPSDMTNYNAREYIQAKLTDTLIANQCYKLKFFVSLADSYDYYKITNFGACFSATAIYDTASYSINSVMDYIPQINYVDPAGIGDSSSWYKIEGTFLASGNEQYITLGNFNNDVNTTSIIFNTSALSVLAYYFIDSVSLTQVVCPIDIGIIENTNPIFHLYPNPANEKLNIQLDNFENTTVIIYNMLGENIFKTKLNSKSVELDISTLDNGVYIISMDNGRGTTRQKIIKNAH